MISDRISDDIPLQMKILNMVIPILCILQFPLKLKHCKPHKATQHQRIFDVINDVHIFPTVYRRICCRNFLTLSNQTSRYKGKCIRMYDISIIIL